VSRLLETMCKTWYIHVILSINCVQIQAWITSETAIHSIVLCMFNRLSPKDWHTTDIRMLKCFPYCPGPTNVAFPKTFAFELYSSLGLLGHLSAQSFILLSVYLYLIQGLAQPVFSVDLIARGRVTLSFQQEHLHAICAYPGAIHPLVHLLVLFAVMENILLVLPFLLAFLAM
jgi:hypothetical protein